MTYQKRPLVGCCLSSCRNYDAAEASVLTSSWKGLNSPNQIESLTHLELIKSSSFSCSSGPYDNDGYDDGCGRMWLGIIIVYLTYVPDRLNFTLTTTSPIWQSFCRTEHTADSNNN